VLSASQLPEADLILAADGANSRIRQANPNFGTDIRVNQEKYIWLGTDRIFDTFAFHFVEASGGWLQGQHHGLKPFRFT